MASNKRQYPIHSETIMSTCGTGRVTSSILPRIHLDIESTYEANHRFTFSYNVRDHIAQAVLIDNLLGAVNDVRVVDGNYFFGASFGTEHGENPRTTSDIQDNFVLEDTFVVVDKVTVGVSADGVLEHRLVDCCRTSLAIL